MANKCTNVLRISGEETKLTTLYNAITSVYEETKEFLGVFYPVREDEMMEKWGVREEAEIIEIQKDTDLQIVFTTVQKEPDKWIERLGKIYPDLAFNLSFYEPGNLYAGNHFAISELLYSEFMEENTDEYEKFVFFKENPSDYEFDVPMCVSCAKDIHFPTYEQYKQAEKPLLCTYCAKGGNEDAAL